MPAVTLTLEDTPAGGVSIHSTFKPAVGQRCSAAQAAALDIIARTNKDWNSSKAQAAAEAPPPQITASTLERVRTQVSHAIDAPLTPADDARHIANDLAMIEIVLFLEDEFGISIPDEDAEKCSTVLQLTALVDNILAKRGAA